MTLNPHRCLLTFQRETTTVDAEDAEAGGITWHSHCGWLRGGSAVVSTGLLILLLLLSLPPVSPRKSPVFDHTVHIHKNNI
ncbi:hypothetical protein NQZ68_003870 [Dissostichus eleginoides]|nr:hypothetical protein NQZ68_003870 [Dissostichus eleginoides]